MADQPVLDLLAIAAHPDDVEITCGGLLINMAKMGRNVGVLDLTRGEMGTRGDENDRDAEANAAAQIIGLVSRINLSLPDSAVEYNQENKLKIAQILRRTRPELVVLPHWEQRHPDHLATSRLAYDACFLAGLQKLDLEGEPFRPHKIIYASYFRNREFSFLVDISDSFRQKLKAVSAYESQFGDSEKAQEMIDNDTSLHELLQHGGRDILLPGVNIYDLMHTRARQLGQLIGVEFAEAYTIKESILVDDPQNMPVSSI